MCFVHGLVRFLNLTKSLYLGVYMQIYLKILVLTLGPKGACLIEISLPEISGTFTQLLESNHSSLVYQMLPPH